MNIQIALQPLISVIAGAVDFDDPAPAELYRGAVSHHYRCSRSDKSLKSAHSFGSQLEGGDDSCLVGL